MACILHSPFLSLSFRHAFCSAMHFVDLYARREWAVNQQRDSLASYMGHFSMLEYFALAENESIGRVKYNLLQVPIPPFSPPLSLSLPCTLCGSPHSCPGRCCCPLHNMHIIVHHTDINSPLHCTTCCVSTRALRCTLLRVCACLCLYSRATQKMIRPCGNPPPTEEAP
jgi:hypothetical protein